MWWIEEIKVVSVFLSLSCVMCTCSYKCPVLVVVLISCVMSCHDHCLDQLCCASLYCIVLISVWVDTNLITIRPGDSIQLFIMFYVRSLSMPLWAMFLWIFAISIWHCPSANQVSGIILMGNDSLNKKHFRSTLWWHWLCCHFADKVWNLGYTRCIFCIDRGGLRS